jgi:hypothetical protein
MSPVDGGPDGSQEAGALNNPSTTFQSYSSAPAVAVSRAPDTTNAMTTDRNRTLRLRTGVGLTIALLNEESSFLFIEIPFLLSNTSLGQDNHPAVLKTFQIRALHSEPQHEINRRDPSSLVERAGWTSQHK